MNSRRKTNRPMLDPSNPLETFFVETLALFAFCFFLCEASSGCFLLANSVPLESSLDLKEIAFFFPFPFGFTEAPSLAEGDEDSALATSIITISQKKESKPTIN